VQAHPPPEVGLSCAAVGALKTESSFSIAMLWHFGQAIFSVVERTIVSKWCLHLRQ